MPGSSRSTRESTVDLPEPEGAETTIALGQVLFNVLHLLAQPLDAVLQ
jgi:hypothetical protein